MQNLKSGLRPHHFCIVALTQYHVTSAYNAIPLIRVALTPHNWDMRVVHNAAV